MRIKDSLFSLQFNVYCSLISSITSLIKNYHWVGFLNITWVGNLEELHNVTIS